MSKPSVSSTNQSAHWPGATSQMKGSGSPMKVSVSLSNATHLNETESVAHTDASETWWISAHSQPLHHPGDSWKLRAVQASSVARLAQAAASASRHAGRMYDGSPAAHASGTSDGSAPPEPLLAPPEATGVGDTDELVQAVAKRARYSARPPATPRRCLANDPVSAPTSDPGRGRISFIVKWEHRPRAPSTGCRVLGLRSPTSAGAPAEPRWPSRWWMCARPRLLGCCR